jgi:ABC-type sugar transport system permease subunit
MLDSHSAKKQRIAYIWFLLPLLFCMFILVIVPISLLFVISFRGWVLIQPGSNVFVGFENYVRMLGDSRFWNSVRVALLLGGGSVYFQMLIGFCLALLLQKARKYQTAIRSLFVLPMVLPDVVIGVIWKILFTPDLGGVNYYLGLLGIEGPDWFGGSTTALITLIIAATWQWVPFVMLTLSAALQSLPEEPFEAARIDGASSWQELIHITIPMLKPAIIVVLLLRVIFSLKYFGLIYTMTGGGPASATEPMNFYAFVTAFNYAQVGYGAGLGVMIFGIILVLTFLVKRLERLSV